MPTIPQPKPTAKWKFNPENMVEVWHDVKTSTAGTAGCHPVFLVVATYVYASKEPILYVGVGSETGFCATQKELNDANDATNTY